ncbi:hypothetical protein [Rhodococcus sp. IEGM 1379]|uniref:hypothetical protein n=1 Tax=Rhodococcus sp. IEGM 1379 TaxID=3047086 RepID=UPI0024B812C2|nr:hypothetical protein [Rhodococcus sp. IEGM 1379]MDI9916786.1 hypothetical protein [Rhodococcus sp. IEGM 1379]
MTAFLYILVRGRGIGERQLAARTATDQYLENVAGTGPAAQITDARALLDAAL